jgi:hypothetical protein
VKPFAFVQGEGSKEQSLVCSISNNKQLLVGKSLKLIASDRHFQ